MDGTGATFIDSSATPKTITAVNATQSAAESKWGGKSGYFSGNNCYISFPDLGIGTGDFCIEMWLKTADTASYRPILSNNNGGGVGCDLFINFNGDGNIDFRPAGSAPIVQSSGVDYSDNQWHYIAVSRSGSTVRLYLDGTLASTGTSSGNLTSSAGDTRVGSASGLPSSYDIVGYIDDLRITVGTDRTYTGATITVPTAAFPTPTPTSTPTNTPIPATSTPTPTNTPIPATSTPTPTPTPTVSDFENTLIYSMLDFNFIDPPSIDHNEPFYSE